MRAYQKAGNASKTIEAAGRVLQADPNNAPALGLLAYYYRSLAFQGGADAPKNAELSAQYGQKGLDALPNTPKPEEMNDADFTKFHNELTAIFDGAVGFNALQKKDLALAQKDLREAVQDESQPNIADIYPLATADLEAKPMNPEGFWFAIKAAQLAQGQGQQQILDYARKEYVRHYGGEDGWADLVKQAQGAQSVMPPAGFTGAAAPPPPSPAELVKKPTAPNAVPRPPATQHQATSAEEPSTPIRVNLKLVNVFSTVTNAGGAPVSVLKQEDFQVYEDGKQQKIAVFQRESELPLSIVLAIDPSLSAGNDQKLELESARRFAHAILRPIDGISLFQFSEVVDQLTPFTANLRVIDKGIGHVHAGAATALYDTLYLGSEALMERRGRKVMVVITDGGDTVSKSSYQEAVREAQQAEVILYSIIVVPIESSAGRDIGGEHALIQLSRDTGGKCFFASSLEQLDAAFRQISDALRTQYLIAYYPSTGLSDSEYRRIEIKIDAATKNYPDPSELQVRHRMGYYAMPAK